MKKGIIILTAVIISITVCIPVFLSYRYRVQAVLFSFATALHTESTFAMQNFKTNNVYILQTNKKEQHIALYRKQNDGTLLRYMIYETTLQKETADKNGWVSRYKVELPASLFDIFTEFENLWKNKTTNTNTIKIYLDLLFSAFSSSGNDSSILFDYSSFSSVVNDCKRLFRSAKTPQAIAFKSERNGSLLRSSFVPFADTSFNAQIADILSSAFREEYKHDIRAVMLDYFDSGNNYKIEITNSLFGQFQNLRIYDESQCIFKIEKLE